MLIDLSPEVIATVVVGVGGVIGAAYGRALTAENNALRSEIQSHVKQHEADMSRIAGNHDDIWQEIKVQRESLTQSKEAVIKLSASIDRLNELLHRLEASSPLTGGRRYTDPPTTIDDFHA